MHSVEEIDCSKNCAVEIHPAVALWLWCKDDLKAPKNNEWFYKDAKNYPNAVGNLWEILLRKWEDIGSKSIGAVISALEVPKDDDELDAVVGWMLGMLLLEKPKLVNILGDAKTGSFALPTSPHLEEAFDKFRCHPSSLK